MALTDRIAALATRIATEIKAVRLASQNASNLTSGTIPSARILTANTTRAGIVQLSSATNSTSATLAATPAAVKTTYDLAASKQSPATTLAGYGITNGFALGTTIDLGRVTDP